MNMYGGFMRKVIFYSGIILLAAMSRLIPHIPNVTPIAAIALAGGVYFERRLALLVPFAALLISDAVIGFHTGMPFVYAGFLITILLGMWLQNHKSVLTVAGASIISSVIFYIITNFGVWLTGGGWYYPRTFAGLIECYTLALPFFRNSLIGDLFYTAVVFGIFEISKVILHSLEKSKA